MACAGGSADKSERAQRAGLLWPATRHLSLDHLPEALCRRSPAVVSRAVVSNESTRRRGCGAQRRTDTRPSVRPSALRSAKQSGKPRARTFGNSMTSSLGHLDFARFIHQLFPERFCLLHDFLSPGLGRHLRLWRPLDDSGIAFDRPRDSRICGARHNPGIGSLLNRSTSGIRSRTFGYRTELTAFAPDGSQSAKCLQDSMVLRIELVPRY